MSEQDRVNQRTWSTPAARHGLGRRSGLLPGEAAPFAYVRDRLARRPVLELGIGTGRTIAFTAPLTDDYRALDYVPAMVEACRADHPGVRIDVGDARVLAGVPDAHFGLVTFAWNGIDAVGHAERALVLRAVRRVLRPDGLFFFSTLNLDGPDPHERPWQVPFALARNPLVLAVRTAKAARYLALQLRNWLRVRPLRETGPGWAVLPLGAHAFGIVAHFTTLARQLDELAAAGFGDIRVYASETGAPVALGDDVRAVGYFHLVAAPTPA